MPKYLEVIIIFLVLVNSAFNDERQSARLPFVSSSPVGVIINSSPLTPKMKTSNRRKPMITKSLRNTDNYSIKAKRQSDSEKQPVVFIGFDERKDEDLQKSMIGIFDSNKKQIASLVGKHSSEQQLKEKKDPPLGVIEAYDITEDVIYKHNHEEDLIFTKEVVCFSDKDPQILLDVGSNNDEKLSTSSSSSSSTSDSVWKTCMESICEYRGFINTESTLIKKYHVPKDYKLGDIINAENLIEQPNFEKTLFTTAEDLHGNQLSDGSIISESDDTPRKITMVVNNNEFFKSITDKGENDVLTKDDVLVDNADANPISLSFERSPDINTLKESLLPKPDMQKASSTDTYDNNNNNNSLSYSTMATYGLSITALMLLFINRYYKSKPISKIDFIEEGFEFWNWKGNKIHYIQKGNPANPPLLLIHGFGASSFHWRYNIPTLAKNYQVFAIDLLGFGLSDKAIMDYNVDLWTDMAKDFVKEMIPKGNKAIVAGNSLGGYVALSLASRHPDLVCGCILLNSAGKFDTLESEFPTEEANEKPDEIKMFKEKAVTFLKKILVKGTFFLTKQPARIEQVLRQVYVDKSNVDEELINFIEYASRSKNAAEVFYRVLQRSSGEKEVRINALLDKLEPMPLLLLWGEKDPWIRPETATRIQTLYPEAKRVSIDGGHCIQDEQPKIVNAEIKRFADSVFSKV